MGGKPEALFRGGEPQTPFLYQVHPGSFWFGDNMVFAGAPVKLLRNDLGDLIVPDLSRRLVYSLTKERLRAHRIDTALTEVGDRDLAWPQPQRERFDGISHRLYRRRDYLLDHPVAVTHGNDLRLFVLDMKTNEILTARTAAFPDGDGSQLAGGSPKRADATSSASPEAAAGAAAAGELGVPGRIAEGAALKIQLEGPAGAEYALMSGPGGMTLSKTGELSWTPEKTHIGRHELKIRVRAPSRIAIARPGIEVIDRELVARSGGALEAVDRFERLVLEPDHYKLLPGAGHRSLLLLQGDQLRILGPDGFTVAREHKLPRRYQSIAERGDGIIALSREPLQLDLLDGRTLRVQKSIPVRPGAVRVLDVTDFAVHPTAPTSYIAIKHDIDLPRYRILVIDELTGQTDAPDDLIGTWIAVDPAGDALYAGYRDIYERGARFHVNPDWRIIVSPDYGSVDWLLSYSLDGGQPTFRQLVREAGGNGNGIRMSADGSRISYLSHVGTPLHSKKLAAWNTADFVAEPVSYAADGASTKLLAFHPSLNIAAVPAGNSAVLFDRETGRVLKGKLQLTGTGLGDAALEDLIFSPDGRSLIFLCSDPEVGRYLRKVGLNLTPAEQARARAGVKLPEKPAPKRPRNVALSGPPA